MAAASPAPKISQEIQEVPLKMVGGNKFGRYSKISVEETFNFIVSDNALVPYAGYKNILTQNPSSIGRGLYASSRGNLMLSVWGSQFYTIVPDFSSTIPGALVATFRGNLETTDGDVFLSENNNGEIAFTDGFIIYVWNWLTDTFSSSGLQGGVTVPASLTNPGYIAFQNGNFLVANNNTSNWYLSDPNDGTTWQGTANFVGSLQSKPDTVQAAVPAPGGGNNLYLFGYNVIEQWQFNGAALFPYQRSSTFNVDYGTLNAASIAALDDYVVWLAGNEQSGATLMALEGVKSTKISTDGIDFKLANLTNPSNCTGFLFRQDGHIIYQFTFPDDNLSYCYDFNTQLFSTVTDENLNYHIARNVVFFNNSYYFVSLNGGNLYAFDTTYTNFDYGDGDVREIPRIRVTEPLRLPSQRMFIIKSLGFTIENGQPNTFTTYSNIDTDGALIATEDLVDITTEDSVILVTQDDTGPSYSYTLASEAIDLSVSRDGGETFGNSWRKDMNPTGKRKSRLVWQRVGQANDATFQWRFSGYGRFVVFNGVAELYQ